MFLALALAAGFLALMVSGVLKFHFVPIQGPKELMPDLHPAADKMAVFFRAHPDVTVVRFVRGKGNMIQIEAESQSKKP